MALQDALYRLNQMGLLDVLLPFALIFTIIYAVSKVVPNIGENDKFRQVISLVIALIVVIPHITNTYPPGMDVVNIINAAIPQVAMVIVGVILVLLLIASTGAGTDEVNIWFKWVRWVAMALVILIFIDSVFITNGVGAIANLPFLSWFGDDYFQAIMLVILIFGLIVWFVAGGKDEEFENIFKASDGSTHDTFKAAESASGGDGSKVTSVRRRKSS